MVHEQIDATTYTHEETDCNLIVKKIKIKMCEIIVLLFRFDG
jgi:hypothetical protein